MGNIEVFNQIAAKYETPERVATANIAVTVIEKYVKDGARKKAIDFGCGTGLVGFSLADKFANMLFLDASAGMIQFVEEKIRNEQVENASALCVDLEKEASDVKPVDYIIVTQVLLHIKNVKSILHKMYELLNEEGHLIIVDFDKNDKVVSELVHNGFDQEMLVGTLKEIGFCEVENEIFYHGKNIFMGQDASMFIMDAKKK